MPECIEKKKLLKAIEESEPDVMADYGEYYGSEWGISRGKLYEIIANLPTLTPPNEWVRVEERSPENNAQVLMWSAKWNIAEAGSYYNERFWVYSEIGDAYIADDITHWMSLPAPPDRRPPEGEENA